MVMLLRLIAHEYQGNDAWAGFGVFSILLATIPWLRYWQARTALYPVKARDAAVASGVFLTFAALALEQILTH